VAERTREPREVLILPVTLLVCAVWALSAGIGALTGDFRFFEIASGPFVMMCGYVFGVKIIRGGRDDVAPRRRE
jgi:hypothetical protein